MTTLSDAIQLRDMSFWGDVRHPKLPAVQRRCRACPTILSQYNNSEDDLCFRCQDRRADRSSQTMTHRQVFHPRPSRHDTETRDAEFARIMDHVRQTGTHLVRDIATAVDLHPSAVAAYMRRAERDGLVRRCGWIGGGHTGGNVTVWEAAEVADSMTTSEVKGVNDMTHRIQGTGR